MYSRNQIRQVAQAVLERVEAEAETPLPNAYLRYALRRLALEKEQSKVFRSRCLGKEAEVLFEETKEIGGLFYRIGYTRDYVKIAVPVAAEAPLPNMLEKVMAEGFLTDEILLAKRNR